MGGDHLELSSDCIVFHLLVWICLRYVKYFIFKNCVGDFFCIFLTSSQSSTTGLFSSYFILYNTFSSEFGEGSEKSTPSSSEINLGGESAKVLLPTRDSGYGELRWFHKLSWLIYTFAIDVGMSVTISFWALLRTDFSPYSWHCHLVNTVCLLLDLIVSDTPIRLLQFTWTFSWGLIYIAFTYLLYKESQWRYVYEGVLDWGACK